MRYPAISPDGKYIAFSYQGDIYTVPYQGGEARRITLHEAYESHPVWSPDGSMIAFASMRHGNSDVFVIPAKGGSPTRLTYHSAPDVPYTFTPDGKHVLYGSPRLDHHNAVIFPTSALPELYRVPVAGGREVQVLTTPAEYVSISPDGSKYLYHDLKAYEDEYRKHQTSSFARDIWLYRVADSSLVQVTTYPGEDRHPVWAQDGDSFYLLSERSGHFNVWKVQLSAGGTEASARQVSFFDSHPVRSLSLSAEGVLCYSWNGEIYTQLETQEPRKVPITIATDRRYNTERHKSLPGGISEFRLAPNGKEAAFIIRGEVFVTALDHPNTRRITNTPEQERDLHFNKDGTKLLYSGERNGSWNIYEASLERPEEKYFYNATLVREAPVVETPAETFRPRYSPDGAEVAFLEERTTLRVKNLKSGEIRTVLPAHLNYSYADGDQYFEWSPDSKWLLVTYLGYRRWNNQVGLVHASGKEQPINLSRSGYGNWMPKFSAAGDVVFWGTDKYGFRSHGSWGAQGDIVAMFLTEDAWQKYRLSKADYELWKESEEERKKKDAEKKEANTKKKSDSKDKTDTITALKIDHLGLHERMAKLTLFSSFPGDYFADKDMAHLYFAARTDDAENLWKLNLRDKEAKVLTGLGKSAGELQIDKDEKFLLTLVDGNLIKVTLADGKVEPIVHQAAMTLQTDAERSYLFDHVERQFAKKFYLPDLHGVDWAMYTANYRRFLPHINNPHDFADMLSELLGEANASHTGAFYRNRDPEGDQTAALGVYIDERHRGDGLRIAEIMVGSPLVNSNAKLKAGVIIEKIDGQPIVDNENYLPLLNRKAGQKVLLDYFNPETRERWSEVAIPISTGAEAELAYKRWVSHREAAVEKLSGGRLGYVHVRGMDSDSFRELYSKALGKYNDREGLIVDTRFNGGGWLHDDLATFLSGKPYLKFEPRGQDNMGGEPLSKWQKPSAVVMNEGNYSDAHLFPYTYKKLGIGKLVGMPVPGTGTAVWWESLQDGTVFGIPQVGMRDPDTGELMENTQLEPDVKVQNLPGDVSRGKDAQLETAIQILLSY